MGDRLADKVAVVTGAASGFGEATARLFVAEGANVVLADIQDEHGQAVADELGDAASYHHCDVTSEVDVAGARRRRGGDLRAARRDVQQRRHRRRVGPIDEIPLEEYEFTMAVLLRSVFLGMKHAARVMKPQHSGVILSTSSVAGLQGGLGTHVYEAAKAAVVALTKNVAAELGAWSIRVNAIAPGKHATPMNADVVVGDPAAVDQAVEALPRDPAAGPDRIADDIAQAVVAGQRRRRIRQRPHARRRRRPDEWQQENVAPGEGGRFDCPRAADSVRVASEASPPDHTPGSRSGPGVRSSDRWASSRRSLCCSRIWSIRPGC